MAIIPVYIPWTVRPPLGTPINWSNPLTNGLVGAWAFNEGGGAVAVNAVNGYRGTTGSTCSFGSNGLSNNTTVNTGGSNGLFPWLKNNAPYSVVAKVTQPTSIAGASAIMGFSNGLGCLLFYAATNTINFKQGGTVTTLSTNSLPIGGIHIVGATFGAAQQRLYFDGVLKNSATWSGTGGDGSTTQLGLAGSSNALYGLNGTLQCCLFYNRELSANEMFALSVNPWQVFQPTIVWVDLYSFSGGSISWATLQAAGFPGTPYQHTGLSTGTYYYTLIATNADGTRSSAEVAVTLSAAQSSDLGSSLVTTNTILSPNLNTGIILSSSILCSSVTVPNLNTNIILATSVLNTSSITNNLNTAIPLLSTISGLNSINSNLKTSIVLSAITACSSSINPTLTAGKDMTLNASISNSTVINANLKTAIRLSSVISSISTIIPIALSTGTTTSSNYLINGSFESVLGTEWAIAISPENQAIDTNEFCYIDGYIDSNYNNYFDPADGKYNCVSDGGQWMVYEMSILRSQGELIASDGSWYLEIINQDSSFNYTDDINHVGAALINASQNIDANTFNNMVGTISFAVATNIANLENFAVLCNLNVLAYDSNNNQITNQLNYRRIIGLLGRSDLGALTGNGAINNTILTTGNSAFTWYNKTIDIKSIIISTLVEGKTSSDISRVIVSFDVANCEFDETAYKMYIDNVVLV